MGLFAALSLAVPAAGLDKEHQPTVGPIEATFVKPVTTYVVSAQGGKGKLHYIWSNSNPCGTFAAADAPTVTWTHPDGSGPGVCPEQDVHPGTITVEVSDAHWVCTAVYSGGSGEGKGAEGGTCVLNAHLARIVATGLLRMLDHKGEVGWDPVKQQYFDAASHKALTPPPSKFTPQQIKDGLIADKGYELEGKNHADRGAREAEWDPKRGQWVDVKTDKPVTPDP
jgi:hypothetical protein